jgi:hypothetical protein
LCTVLRFERLLGIMNVKGERQLWSNGGYKEVMLVLVSGKLVLVSGKLVLVSVKLILVWVKRVLVSVKMHLQGVQRQTIKLFRDSLSAQEHVDVNTPKKVFTEAAASCVLNMLKSAESQCFPVTTLPVEELSSFVKVIFSMVLSGIMIVLVLGVASHTADLW